MRTTNSENEEILRLIKRFGHADETRRMQSGRTVNQPQRGRTNL